MMKREELTQCELLVMKIIWDSEEPLSIKLIAERVNRKFEKKWAVQTVSAFLGHIVQKEYLSMERKGRHFFYTPLVSEEDYRTQEFTKSVQFWSNGEADKFLAAFLQDREFTAEEKQRMRKLIDELD
ncbi:MAG: BlaI/MecI/CopY family transcriptional regulator [Lachnospiraceae bacterium]|nr:BlaI/MecI/CopY family transcriptional regulator [Lachnospiraceae bacterium]